DIKVKKIFIILFGAITVLSINTPVTLAESITHYVASGDTLSAISNKYNVPIEAIKKKNDQKTSDIFAGDHLKIPTAITSEEKDLLARLVRAEAEGEPYAGKVAVATVVLNRVDYHEFPNTVRGVIEEVTPGGYYAFSPVLNGEINKPADEDSMLAVEEA